jgi:hypothetical protein
MPKEISNLKLEGVYTLEGDYLKSSSQMLQLGQRHFCKKGQSKRYIGWIDPTKPEDEKFVYVSGLWGKNNSYELEHAGVQYTLEVVNPNTVEIKVKVKKPVLSFVGESVGVSA